jgi:hypothetical protein
VELPGDGWLPIKQLGEACQVAKRSVGKLHVLAFKTTSEIFAYQLHLDTHMQRQLLRFKEKSILLSYLTHVNQSDL